MYSQLSVQSVSHILSIIISTKIVMFSIAITRRAYLNITLFITKNVQQTDLNPPLLLPYYLYDTFHKYETNKSKPDLSPLYRSRRHGNVRFGRQQDLWRPVPARGHVVGERRLGLVTRLSAGQGARQAKVSDLDVAVGIQQYVGRLKQAGEDSLTQMDWDPNLQTMTDLKKNLFKNRGQNSNIIC